MGKTNPRRGNREEKKVVVSIWGSESRGGKRQEKLKSPKRRGYSGGTVSTNWGKRECPELKKGWGEKEMV